MYTKNFPKFKMPKTLIRNINGVYLDEKYNCIDISKELNLLNNGDYIIKETLDTSGGKGVKGFKKYLGKYFLFDSETTEINILDFIKKFNKNYLLQEKIKQYKELAKLHENSLNTIRIVSYRNLEKINILSAVLRMGNNGFVVDNSSSGGFAVGIDIEKGILKSVGVGGKNNVVKNTHSYAKEKFSDFQIPNFDKLKTLIKEYHSEIPYYFDLVSWDIGIDENSEFFVIELNLGAQEINFHQKTNGPLFGDLTDEVLERVFLRKD